MSESEKAQFVLAIISSDQVSIPASLAKQLVECQEWLELFAAPDKKVTKL